LQLARFCGGGKAWCALDPGAPWSELPLPALEAANTASDTGQANSAFCHHEFAGKTWVRQGSDCGTLANALRGALWREPVALPLSFCRRRRAPGLSKASR